MSTYFVNKQLDMTVMASHEIKLILNEPFLTCIIKFVYRKHVYLLVMTSHEIKP